MKIATEARKGILSSMHPSFNLLKLTRQLMIRELPDNAHLLASGKLCISLTRLSDWKNVLVSEFSSKDDLIQRYIDGALSDSTPFSSLKNTIIVSPFSGESDICPDDNPVYCQEVRLCNMSININLLNVHRVIQAFFPPESEATKKHGQKSKTFAVKLLLSTLMMGVLPVEMIYFVLLRYLPITA
ncbi:Patatin-like phospholipase domain-containing protein 2 [Bagarius yarrelli]|uniref:Patatin-like phospholipase domain-containing protein 2 n=1 Tax=Bagarius yarrelli TaxID=175774 RepID=A0A556V0K3_BAGYA|nr:Patatin-like phospholipase domain-containing protein 2 [Bagarius yarrelli]